MAVLDPRDELAVALDDLGSLISTPVVDTIADATAIASLWRRVFDRAMDRGDWRVAQVAADQWCDAMRVIRSLAASASPP